MTVPLHTTTTTNNSSSRRHYWTVCMLFLLVGFLNLFLTNYWYKLSFSASSYNGSGCNTRHSIGQTSAIRKPISDSRVSKLLPNRLIVVVGLESSGTTFTTAALAKALGFKDASNGSFERGKFRLIDPSPEREVEIQHFSLPWGNFGKPDGTTTMPKVIPFIPPDECMYVQTLTRFNNMAPEILKQTTHTLIGDANKKACFEDLRINNSGGKIRLPLRFFLNVTSHVRWYRERGVDATAVIVIRDKSIHLRGVYKKHVLYNKTEAKEESQVGLNIINTAMTDLIPSHHPAHDSTKSPELLLVSYETLMYLKGAYLQQIYQQLNILSEYTPYFHDGNGKYIVPEEG